MPRAALLGATEMQSPPRPTLGMGALRPRSAGKANRFSMPIYVIYYQIDTGFYLHSALALEERPNQPLTMDCIVAGASERKVASVCQ